jgi:hypothetical protein
MTRTNTAFKNWRVWILPCWQLWGDVTWDFKVLQVWKKLTRKLARCPSSFHWGRDIMLIDGWYLQIHQPQREQIRTVMNSCTKPMQFSQEEQCWLLEGFDCLPKDSSEWKQHTECLCAWSSNSDRYYNTTLLSRIEPRGAPCTPGLQARGLWELQTTLFQNGLFERCLHFGTRYIILPIFVPFGHGFTLSKLSPILSEFLLVL